MFTCAVKYVVKTKYQNCLKCTKTSFQITPKISDLIENWDVLDISSDLLDIAGCLIPDESHIHAALNGRRFILRPTEHAPFHVKASSSKGVEPVTNVATNKLVPNEKGIVHAEAVVSSGFT